MDKYKITSQESADEVLLHVSRSARTSAEGMASWIQNGFTNSTEESKSNFLITITDKDCSSCNAFIKGIRKLLNSLDSRKNLSDQDINGFIDLVNIQDSNRNEAMDSLKKIDEKANQFKLNQAASKASHRKKQKENEYISLPVEFDEELEKRKEESEEHDFFETLESFGLDPNDFDIKSGGSMPFSASTTSYAQAEKKRKIDSEEQYKTP